MAAEGGKGATRRQMLAAGLRLACGAGTVALLAGLPTARRAEAVALRPPGALPEEDFAAACVRCGLCIRACPYNTLKPAGGEDPVPLGTPIFHARTVACEMCEEIPCAGACPTGALAKSLKDIRDARMGVAVLVGDETCLNMLGLRCDVCYRVCPLSDQAITLEVHHNERTGKHAVFAPTVHSAKCTGCGKCERACVLDEAAIKVLPHALAVGALGGHYRLGWVEKAKAGKPLVDGIINLPVRGLNGPAGGAP